MRRDEHTSCAGFRSPPEVLWRALGNSWCSPVRRPRAGMQSRHSGGASPGDTTVPCQELADDRRLRPIGESAAR